MATATSRIGDHDGTAEIQPASVPDQGSEQMALVERIAASEAFQKSSRLPALLRYLAECTLRGDRAGLTEQAIGRAVFDKPADFHPTEDSSVRVYVRQLRLRLYEYFQSAGQDERIVIEIPKGAYALAFHVRHTLSAAPNLDRIPTAAEPIPTTLPTESSEARSRTVSWWLPWALCAAMFLVAVTGWLRWYRAEVAAAPPWPLNQVVEPGRSTTMVLADASYILRLLGDRRFTLDEYADRKYIDGLIPPDATRGELTLFHYLKDAQITSMADARAVSAMTTLAGSLRDQLVIRSAKEMNGSAMSSGNFIIVGAKNSNPWDELYETRTNFRLVEGGPHGARYIDNLAPQPGEQPFYAVHESTGYSGEDFATVSLLPALNDQGSTLLIQGLRREGTDASILFLASPSHRASLEQALRTANHGLLPKYFEALLRSHAVAGSATSIDCIAVRAIIPAKQ
jgi:hypothetical protein